MSEKLLHIFERNRRWAESVTKEDPRFFEKLSALQKPEFLWIGCSDSRVPANQITGLLPGEVFVHRNVGNIVGPTDLNCLAVLQYAIEVLGVQHVIVCGHYGCGAVQAVFYDRRLGLIDYWLSAIREIRDRNIDALASLQNDAKKMDCLCELSVLAQARSVCNTAIIQDQWAKKRKVSVHGWIYGLANGRINDLGFSVSSNEELYEAGHKQFPAASP